MVLVILQAPTVLSLQASEHKLGPGRPVRVAVAGRGRWPHPLSMGLLAVSGVGRSPKNALRRGDAGEVDFAPGEPLRRSTPPSNTQNIWRPAPICRGLRVPQVVVRLASAAHGPVRHGKCHVQLLCSCPDGSGRAG